MYLGSVRFYKHIILVTLALMIIIPLTFAIVLLFRSQELANELHAVKALAAQSSKNAGEPVEIADAEVALGAIADGEANNSAASEIVAETMPYQLSYPELYATQTQKKASVDEKIVYLTFDDGPSTQTTKVLDILDEEKIKATFFVVYKNDDFSNSLYKEIVNRGHTIAVHSASHDYNKIYDSVDSYLEDFNKMYQHIYEVTGQKIELFRFPGGSINAYNQSVYQPLIAEMLRRGFTFHDWNVASGDASTKSTKESIYSSTVDNVKKKGKSVVLMHDSVNREDTVAALPKIIQDIKKEGYSFNKLDATVAPFLFSYKN